MAGQLLPSDGKITFPQLAGAIAMAPRSVGVPDWVSLRTVAFHSEANLLLFGGAVFVGEDLGLAEVIKASNGVLLIGNRASATSLKTSDALQEFLQSWRRMVDSNTPVFGYNNSISVRRHVRGDVPTRPLPYWQMDLYEGTTMGTAPAPLGAVISSKHSLLYESVNAAAAEFLRNPFIQGWGGTRNSLDLIVWDSRAFIEAVDVEGSRLHVRVQKAIAMNFHCGVVFKEEGNARASARASVVDGRASFDVPKGVDWYEVILAGEDDFAYDEKRGGLMRRGKPSAKHALRQRLMPRIPAIGGLALGEMASDRVRPAHDAIDTTSTASGDDSRRQTSQGVAGN
jgi:hypothetical protein